MVRQLKWALIVWMLLTAVSFADGPDFFDLSWGDELVGREWVVMRGESVRHIVDRAITSAKAPDSMVGQRAAADAFYQWQYRQDWSHVKVYQRTDERATVAGFPIRTIRYYTLDDQLVAVEVSFESANPSGIADAIRARYGDEAIRESPFSDMMTYEDERTRATFLVRLLTLESVQHLRDFGDQIYSNFLAEYEAEMSKEDLW